MAPIYRRGDLTRPLKRTGQTLLIGGLCLSLTNEPVQAQTPSRSHAGQVQQSADVLEREAPWREEPWYERSAPWHTGRDRRNWKYPKRPQVAAPNGAAEWEKLQKSQTATLNRLDFTWRFGGDGPFARFGVPEAFVDIDGDGDLDVFRRNLTVVGTLDFFENIGTAADAAFVERTGGAHPLDVANATLRGMRPVPAFVDVDNDGDFDAFIGNRTGGVSFFENTGTAADPAFIERTGSANPLDGVDIGYASRPIFADIDDDGDYDAILDGYDDLYSYIKFFENTGASTDPTFVARTHDDNPFSGFVGYETRLSLTLVDIDDDGDLDAFIGFSMFENLGTATSPEFRFAYSPGPLAGFGHGDYHTLASIPSFVDIDADGDFDAFVGNDFFENVGTATDPAFPSPASPNPFHLAHVPYDPKPSFVDIDGDGDFDAFVPRFFENTGTTTDPIFVSGGETRSIVFNGAPNAFVDIDADGDFDAFTGTHGGSVVFAENTGTATDPVFSRDTDNPLAGVDVGSLAAPAFADIDNDGDFDAFIANGEYYNADIHFFENTGSPRSASFVERTGSKNPLDFVEVREGNDYIGRLIPAFADVDLDGDFDAVVGSAGGGLRWFLNGGSLGSAHFTELTGSDRPITAGGHMTAPAFVDIDADGDADLFVGFGRPVDYYNYYYDYDRFSHIVWARNDTSPPQDTAPPECEIVSIDKGPPTRLDIRVQDAGSGLASITILNDVNAAVSWPAFPAGSTDEILVTAEKISQEERAVVALRVEDIAGNTTECDPVLTTLTAEVPDVFQLEQNYPNPFNPQTTIRFQIVEAAHVQLAIYDMTGREVVRLMDASTAAGTFEVEWDGMDAAGQSVPSGMYFYRMRAGRFEQSRTMIILR